MKTVQFLGDSLVEVIEADLPTPGRGDVLVKIRSSALCGSEMGAYRGPLDPAGHPQKPCS